jgi:hypothetical protein
MKLRIPNPHADDIGRGLLVRILRQAGVNVPGPRTSQPSMTDVADCLVDQLVHLFLRDMARDMARDVAGAGCHAVQVRNQIPNGCLAVRRALGGSLGSSIMAGD